MNALLTRHLPALLLAGLAMGSLSARAQAPAGTDALPFQLKVDTLENGLTVVRVPFPSPGLVAYDTVVRVGSRNEVEPGRTGFAHFFEHMMFRGTPNYPEGARDALLARLGFNDNAFTNSDVTVYTVFGPSSGLDKVVEVEADRFQNLRYAEASFQTEARAVLGEYFKNAARPELKLRETLLATAFQKHTYRHTTLGFLEDIRGMPNLYEYSRQFFQRWYTPDNTVVIVVGDFDDDALMKQVRAHYGDWKRSDAPTVSIPTEPRQSSARSATVVWEQPTQPRLVFTWKAPAAHADSKEAAVQELLGAYLAGPTSPLYKSEVLEKQRVQSISPYSDGARDPGLFGVWAVLKDARSRDVVQRALLAEVNAVARGRVDAKRLADLQSNARYGALMYLDTPDTVAVALAREIGITGDPHGLGKYVEHLAAVTPADLTAYVKRYMTHRSSVSVFLHHVPGAQSAGKKEASK
ncbi:MAG TPA: pitrilysin family protein [Myxococcaceae bacterium]|nr:pitrilysin family protein [Myxococcaceae bacterium]